MALVPLPPVLPLAEDSPEVKPAYHINRRKGHEKIMIDLLKRKIIRKGMTKIEPENIDQQGQDKDAANT